MEQGSELNRHRLIRNQPLFRLSYTRKEENGEPHLRQTIWELQAQAAAQIKMTAILAADEPKHPFRNVCSGADGRS